MIIEMINLALKWLSGLVFLVAVIGWIPYWIYYLDGTPQNIRAHECADKCDLDTRNLIVRGRLLNHFRVWDCYENY